MKSLLRRWIACSVIGLAAAPAGAFEYFTTADEATFNAAFPDRAAVDFTDAGDARLATIATPEATISQVAPPYASLLDADIGFVWQTDGANQDLGRLRIDFAEPVVAASMRYNWFPLGALSGELGELSISVRLTNGVVGAFTPQDAPFKQGWLGVSFTELPFTSLELDFSGITGDLSFYFYDTAQGGALEYVPAPALSGDYDADGDVDADDYAVWRTNFGAGAVVPGISADGNADSLINAADYTVWRDNLSAQPAAIPEPAALAGAVTMTLISASRSLSRRASRTCG